MNKEENKGTVDEMDESREIGDTSAEEADSIGGPPATEEESLEVWRQKEDEIENIIAGVEARTGETPESREDLCVDWGVVEVTINRNKEGRPWLVMGKREGLPVELMKFMCLEKMTHTTPVMATNGYLPAADVEEVVGIVSHSILVTGPDGEEQMIDDEEFRQMVQRQIEGA